MWPFRPKVMTLEGKLRRLRADKRVIRAVKALRRGDLLIRIQGVDWVLQGATLNERAVEPLAEAISEDEEPLVRKFAVRQLCRISLKTHVSVLDPLVRALSDRSPSVSEEAAECLGVLREVPAIAALCAVRHSRSGSLGDKASEALRKMGEPAVEPLLEAIRRDTAAGRARAATVLGKIGDSRAVEPLCILLGDKQCDVRASAAEALGSIGDNRSLEPLRVLLGDEDAWVRLRAAEALGDIGDPRATEALQEAVRTEEDGNTRTWMGAALKWIAEAERVQTLDSTEALCAALLNDNRPGVRASAARTLARIGDSRALAALQETTQEDPSRRVKDAALQAIAQIESLQSDREVTGAGETFSAGCIDSADTDDVGSTPERSPKVFGDSVDPAGSADIMCFRSEQAARAYLQGFLGHGEKTVPPRSLEAWLVSLKPGFWMVSENNVHFAVVFPRPVGRPPSDPYAACVIGANGVGQERATEAGGRGMSTDISCSRLQTEVILQILDRRSVSG